MLPTKPFSTIYVTQPNDTEEIHKELENESEIIQDLAFSSIQKPDVCFAQDIWLNPQKVEFTSISEAANILKKAGKFWFLYPIEQVRRSRLIEEQLRKLPSLERHFPITDPIPEIGCFSLLDKHTLVYSAKRWKKWPMGTCHFIEDKINPPNRAYLKLWEALTLLDRYPASGDTAVDLGASPGGWTYVMQSLGAHVTAVDKAELDPAIAKRPHVKFLKQSAFALEPQTFDGTIDWLLSDVACYPERLYDLVCKWIESGKAKQMIFTIKLQGETNLDMIRKFQAIPNSRTLHLFHNKHEATFFHPAPPNLFPQFD